jgi:23S rRNA (uracil1939-C5)-methyltransferase
MKKQSQPSTRETTENKPRVGDIFDLTIATLDDDGYGIGRSGETQVLVTGALPGETVRVRVFFAGHREIFAASVKVLRNSPKRLQTPPCASCAACNYCPLIAMKYPAQLDWKMGIVENALRGYAALNGVTPRPLIPSLKPLHYRNSARFVIAGRFTAPAIGINRHNSKEVIDITDCPLYHPLINRVVQAVREGIKKGKVTVYSERHGTGLLRYLVVRVSEAENRVMAVFVTAQRSFNEIHHLGKFLQGAVPEVEVVVQNVNDSPGKAIFGEKDHFVTKKRVFHDTIGAIRFDVSPRSFFPVNNGASQAVYEIVREWGALTGRETVIGLYCGNSGIPLYLARFAKTVVGIEWGERGVAEAEKNARLNGIRNCSFEAGTAADILSELRGEGICPDLIVINMPRNGCEKEVLQQVVLLAPARIIHLSGSLQLAHDLDNLSRLGYRTLEVQPIDAYPQTGRMEIVSLLVKGERSESSY